MQALFDLIGRRCCAGTLELVAPDGRRWRLGSGPDTAAVQLREPSALWRMLANPRLAFAEAYMNGQWEPLGGTLADVLRICVRNLDHLEPAVVPVQWWNRIRTQLDQLNTRRRAQANVHHHYDIDHALYRRFLDRDLHYSCAYFRDPDDTLEAAQQAKCAHIAAKLDLRPGARVLDIGCGWGSLAMYLAEHHGAHCVGITLSQEQLKVAQARARERGLQDRVEFLLQDYREGFAGDTGGFDAIVSVGMFEHVGRPQYALFFRRVKELLAPDGVALLHTIGRYSAGGGSDPWIRKYIFPGGYIPAASEILAAVESSGLIGGDLEFWRLHYALTLEHWNVRFQAARAEIAAHMGERFCRMWEFYLQACAACFRHGDLTVFQLQLARTLDRLPVTRDYLYPAAAAVPGTAASRPTKRRVTA
ncbi:class I SAM-dependent methyltransferase [Pseudomonas aeruginosa]|uniref:SAM-dependent methyltransferase n=1 Tax=Gammaproteobacteria TaxID=1236 RepID=UPI0009A40A36|nr:MULTISPECIES: cyclopropane-fatty-acyl-phospholipid synthase family protein [Gammaproteobacteria]EIZ0539876.1 class I SAM-dependent methyltransferase [Pseudomonas aeruginosa]EKV4127243.1 class I SAM-dependent methyltransferase [Pseudomonas aeruginosa]EKW0411121.1 class I SAM-dependent methyltransferase [Pseudomonas aeruginosa]EKW1417689.1 class I SAM-dependent methyltransferase [Pseudomonas aeruginosa]EKW1532575.1 class I SAM-dependent methyltransferase [Pseudomonas aeruginosa]